MGERFAEGHRLAAQERPRPDLPAAYRIEGFLGEGASGTVYAVHQVDAGTRHALKALRSAGAMDLVAFKREFRAVRGLSHPNLVRLDELFEHRGRFFYTMELVDGEDLLRSVGADAPWSPEREARVRDAFRQLAEVVHFAHEARKVHRDIKPGNVRIDPHGRLVLLDFGIVADLDREGTDAVVGTPEYMAPEQALGEAVTPAADWYAVGALLYAALTGRAPYQGTVFEIIQRKVAEEVVFPRGAYPAVPEDLASLCEALLRVEAAERPSGAAVVAALTGHQALPSASKDGLVGRGAELAVLEEALATARRGATRAVLVEGASGVGKTELVATFLKAAARQGDVLVLRGRCHESESVPFKGLDPIVDELAAALDAGDPRVAGLAGMPAVDMLARVFPPLRHAQGQSSQQARFDGARGREQLFQALRQVIVALAGASVLVLFVDDLQWIDSDSLDAFAGLFEGDGSGPVLFLATSRGRGADEAPWPLPFASIRIGELAEAEAAAMALGLGCDPARLPDLLRQAQGHPLFLLELLRAGTASGKSLDDLVRDRVARLSPRARELLLASAVAELPTDVEALAAASGMSASEAVRAVDDLERTHLARVVGRARGRSMAPYHDRVRQAVVAGLAPPELALLHRRLAAELEGRDADAERLLRHHLGAGAPEKALAAAERAADRARAAFAFARAVVLYQRALDLTPADEPQGRADLLARLAEALAGARRAGEAAQCFEEAARLLPPEARLDLERRAAEELCHAGLFERGTAYLRRVTTALGAPVSAVPWLAVLVGALYRVRWMLAWRRARAAPASPSPAGLQRMDAYWAVSAALSHVDTVAASEFSARQLVLCLAAGDPYRLSRALTLEAAFVGTLGSRWYDLALRMLGRARSLAESPPRPEGLGWAALVEAFLLFFATRFDEALRGFDACEEDYGRKGFLDQRMHDTVVLWSFIALMHKGDLEELGRRMQAWQKDARDRRDAYITMLLDGGETNVFHLFTRGAEEARSRLESARPLWLRDRFTMHHLMGGVALGHILLYEGRAADALAAIAATARGYRGTVLFPLIPYARARVAFLTGVAGVAVALAEQRPALARRSRRAARRLARGGTPYLRALGALLAGCAEAALGRPREASAAFHDAEGTATTAGLRLHAAVARLRWAQLAGDGVEIARTEAGLRAAGVLDVEATAGVLAPLARRG